MKLNKFDHLEQLYFQRLESMKALKASNLWFLSDFVYKQKQKNPQLVFSDNTRLSQLLLEVSTESSLKSILRQFRNWKICQFIRSEFSPEPKTLEVMSACSELADECIQEALEWLMKDHVNKFGTPSDDSGDPQYLVVIAMGKLGGGELNLSSDIDLIFAYPETGHTFGAKRCVENEVFFHRLAQRLVNVLSEVTADGFVFRVDVRLRPYGDSGALVLSFDALANYYLEQGRDWERFAMVKARVITGSDSQKQTLNDILNPFVYRRYIDFSMLESPRQMKLQIEVELRRRNLSNNLKLGSGGIREIEFIVQAIQLIHGGKKTELQLTSTLKGLTQIKLLGLLSEKDCDSLNNAYLKLRHWEHCLQGFNDQQTQNLPEDEMDRQRLCFIDNKKSWNEWKEELNNYRSSVHQIFLHQFEDTGRKQRITIDSKLADLWRLPDSCDDNVNLVKQLGYDEPENFLSKLSDFKRRVENNSKNIGTRAQQKLQRLIPEVINLCGRQENSLESFHRMILLIEEVSTRTAYLELFVENKQTLVLLIYLFSCSPWVARHTRQYPLVLDDLLNPLWQKQPLNSDQRQQLLRQSLSRVADDDDEQLLGVLREFKQSQYFQLAAGFISNQLSLDNLANNLSVIADVIVIESLKIARNKVEERFGRLIGVQGDNIAFEVVALGKLGSRELGFSSDLDLIFVHENCSQLTQGPKIVEASQFFVKIAQKMIHILTTRMPSGVLFEIDTRLRPMGSAGLLVTSIDDFDEYQMNKAWTWEHQAIIRARPLSSRGGLASQIEAIRDKVIGKFRKKSQLLADVIKMREKMKNHFGRNKKNGWSLKNGEGGITDIEFLIQYLVLLNANKYHSLRQSTSMMRLLKRLGQLNIIENNDVKQLTAAYVKYREYMNIISLQEAQPTIEKDWRGRDHAISELIDKYLC